MVACDRSSPIRGEWKVLLVAPPYWGVVLVASDLALKIDFLCSYAFDVCFAVRCESSARS